MWCRYKTYFCRRSGKNLAERLKRGKIMPTFKLVGEFTFKRTVYERAMTKLSYFVEYLLWEIRTNIMITRFKEFLTKIRYMQTKFLDSKLIR